MIESYAIYISLLLLCWLCAGLANRYNQKGYIWVIIWALTLVAGLRDASVGMDTANYLRLFGIIDNGLFHLAFGLEESFKYIVYGILRVIPNRQFLLGLFAFITNWCIITRFWELRKMSSFSCMVLCYYMAFYFMTFNALRQFVAVGIVFYCTRYLGQKKILPFVCGVLVAVLFHQTAVIGFALLAVNCLRWKELPKRQKVLYIFVVLMIPGFVVIALQMFSRYAKYFAHPTMDIGMMILLKLLFLVGTLIMVFVFHSGYDYFRNGHLLNSEERYMIRISSVCYVAALLLAALGYIFEYTERISLYYYLFESVYFGMLLKSKNPANRLMFGYFIAFVIGYGFLYSMTNNSQGTMPYTFCW